MSPTKRRERQEENAKEDLIRILQHLHQQPHHAEGDQEEDDDDYDDEMTLPVLKQALEEGLEVDFKVSESSAPMFDTFVKLGMLKCFEECFMLGTSHFTKATTISRLIRLACDSRASDATATRIVRLLLTKDEEEKKFVEETYQEKAVNNGYDIYGNYNSHSTVTRTRKVEVPNPEQTTNRVPIINSAWHLGRFNIIRLVLAKWKSRSTQFANTLLRTGLASCEESVRIAIEHGAEVKTLTPRGPPVIVAAMLPDSKILQLLLTAGADINTKSKAGETPLLAAARRGSVECAKLLMEKGCDDSVENAYGATAVTVAIQHGHSEVLKQILSTSQRMGVILEDCLECIVNDDFECFKLAFPRVPVAEVFKVVHRLVDQKKYEMLSHVLFECAEFVKDVLPEKELKYLLGKSTAEDIKKLIQAKIDVLNGTVRTIKVESE